MSKVLVEDIWAEDLFKWFYNHVQDSGGDGAGAIVCSNYKEVADWFIVWWKKEISSKLPNPNQEFWHPKEEIHNSINFHDCNENFIFTNEDLDLGHHDYSFVVVGDCNFAHEPPNSEKIIRKIN